MLIDWERTQVQITLTGRAAWPEGATIGWRGSVAHHCLWVGIGGRGLLRGKGNGRITLAADSCLWLTPGHLYDCTQDPKDPVRNYYIHFELLDAQGRPRPDERPILPEQLTPGDSELVQAAARRITTLLPYFSRDQVQRYSPSRLRTAETLLRALLMDLDASAGDLLPQGQFGTQLAHNEAILRVIELVRQRPNARHTVASLAEVAGYSLEHFSRTFRAVLGQPPEQYLIEQRMLQAQILLTTTSMTVYQIARALGYQRAGFFSTQFRTRIGLTPRAFRSQRKQQPK